MSALHTTAFQVRLVSQDFLSEAMVSFTPSTSMST